MNALLSLCSSWLIRIEFIRSNNWKVIICFFILWINYNYIWILVIYSYESICSRFEIWIHSFFFWFNCHNLWLIQWAVYVIMFITDTSLILSRSRMIFAIWDKASLKSISCTSKCTSINSLGLKYLFIILKLFKIFVYWWVFRVVNVDIRSWTWHQDLILLLFIAFSNSRWIKWGLLHIIIQYLLLNIILFLLSIIFSWPWISFISRFWIWCCYIISPEIISFGSG